MAENQRVTGIITVPIRAPYLRLSLVFEPTLYKHLWMVSFGVLMFEAHQKGCQMFFFWSWEYLRGSFRRPTKNSKVQQKLWKFHDWTPWVLSKECNNGGWRLKIPVLKQWWLFSHHYKALACFNGYPTLVCKRYLLPNLVLVSSGKKSGRLHSGGTAQDATGN